MKIKTWAFFLFFFYTACSLFAQENLIFNGGFELSSDKKPLGWQIWGSLKPDEISIDFETDLSTFHSGSSSLRIYHLPNAKGYVVSSPKYALRPKKNTIFHISFWIKSDKPGKALFWITAYKDINTYQEASPIVFPPIKVDTKWRKYEFDIREGVDFHSDTERFLILSFKPTPSEEESRTIWIDDVVVTVSKGANITVHINHRLKPGSMLIVYIDPNKKLRKTQKRVCGVAFHRVAGYTGQPYNKLGKYTLLPEIEKAIKELHLPMTRFYGLYDEPFGPVGAINRVAKLCNRLNIPQENTVLELEPQNGGKVSPELWAQIVRYAISKGYKFRYWEISNEPERVSHQKGIFKSAQDYLQHFLQVSKYIKKVQPDAQIGLPISESPMWGDYLMKKAAGYYDFVTGHFYASPKRKDFEYVTLTSNYKILKEILRVNKLIKLYNPNRHVYQLDTEWGLHCAGPFGEPPDLVKMNGNIFGLVHRAVRMIYYIREGIMEGTTSWLLLSHADEPGFGLLTQDAPNYRFMLYWLYYYFNRYLGDWVLDISGTSPYLYKDRNMENNGPLTPVLATISKDNKIIYLIIANGSWSKRVPALLKLSDSVIKKAKGIKISSSNPNAYPLIRYKKEIVSRINISTKTDQIKFDITPHSVIFVKIRINIRGRQKQ